MTWTRFMDMHSGGGMKEPPYQYIYIEAPKDEAEVIFYNRFRHNPRRVTCTCCGDDYSIDESPSLAEASAYDRGCDYIEDARGWTYPQREDQLPGRYIEPGEEIPPGYAASRRFHRGPAITVEEYAAKPDVLVIPASEIKPEERRGEIPQQGYVWVGE